jgi:hypothetical protein
VKNPFVCAFYKLSPSNLAAQLSDACTCHSTLLAVPFFRLRVIVH